MNSFARTDTSLLGRWWWTVDRWTLLSLIALMLAASPAAAERIGLQSFQLASRQLVLLPVAAALLIAMSLATPRWVRRIACLGLLASIFLLIVTLATGTEIKGATRWISLGAISLQPSEFVKPCFAVVSAWMFTLQREENGIPGAKIALGLWLLVTSLLLMQPDVGQAVLLSVIWGTQLFLAGLPLAWIAILAMLGAGSIVAAYFALPHVSARIDSFFDPAAGDRYQVNRSLEAFVNGGLLGRGPGEGTVKAQLPDAHSDFIFAVAGEEMGLIACLIILGLFAFVVLRGFARLLGENSLFVLLAASGLLVQFGLQAFINMASTLHLMPTKGMTLPFLSYGGSSLMALALGMGMLLALTRRRVNGEAA